MKYLSHSEFVKRLEGLLRLETYPFGIIKVHPSSLPDYIQVREDLSKLFSIYGERIIWGSKLRMRYSRMPYLSDGYDIIISMAHIMLLGFSIPFDLLPLYVNSYDEILRGIISYRLASDLHPPVEGIQSC